MNIVCYGFLVVFTCQTPPAAPPVVICPPVPEWSKTYQARLADEFAALPPDAAARQAIREALQMRKRARACKGR